MPLLLNLRRTVLERGHLGRPAGEMPALRRCRHLAWQQCQDAPCKAAAARFSLHRERGSVSRSLRVAAANDAGDSLPGETVEQTVS